jgi:hypothetical protein
MVYLSLESCVNGSIGKEQATFDWHLHAHPFPWDQGLARLSLVTATPRRMSLGTVSSKSLLKISSGATKCKRKAVYRKQIE